MSGPRNSARWNTHALRLFLSCLFASFAGSLITDAAEIEGLPAPTAPRPAQVLTPHEKTLANGLRVIVVERPGLPLVTAELLLRSGSESDPAAASGLAAFTAALLTQGTATRSATQIAREVEALGASLKASAEWDGSAVTLTTLATQAEPAFALLADVARNPKFAEAEVERLRRQTLDELRVSLEEPRTLARLAASRAVLGHGLYAHPAGGTPASIQKLRRQDVADFHAARYAAGSAQLIIAGDLTANAAFALAEKNFGDWNTPPPKGNPAAASFEPSAKPRAILIDMPTAGQAAVVLAAPNITRNAPDYLAGLVTNAVLGAGYTSRLNQEIRVKRGLSYGAGSTLDALRGGGMFTARCQTKNVSAAEVIRVMRAEIQRLDGEPVPADYLATRQAVLSGDFARDLEKNSGYVDLLAELAMHGLPLAELATYLDRIERTTSGQVRAFASEHLHADAMTVVVAGRAKECAAQLRKDFPALEIIPQADLDLDSPTLRRAKSR